MTSPRKLGVLLCALMFAFAPAHALAQSGAGDDQYQDPFGSGSGSTSSGSGSSSSGSGSSGSGSQSSGSGSSGSSSSGSSGSSGSGSSGSSGSGSGAAAADPSDSASLSSDPPSDSSLTTPPPINKSTTSGAAGSGARTALPNTGVDTRLIVAAGLALLLVGIGLRLRTADDRRS